MMKTLIKLSYNNNIIIIKIIVIIISYNIRVQLLSTPTFMVFSKKKQAHPLLCQITFFNQLAIRPLFFSGNVQNFDSFEYIEDAVRKWILECLHDA